MTEKRSPERRETCLLYQNKVDRLELKIEGNGRQGLSDQVNEIEKDVIGMKTRLTILTTLQSITMIAIITAVVKIIFVGV